MEEEHSYLRSAQISTLHSGSVNKSTPTLPPHFKNTGCSLHKDQICSHLTEPSQPRLRSVISLKSNPAHCPAQHAEAFTCRANAGCPNHNPLPRPRAIFTKGGDDMHHSKEKCSPAPMVLFTNARQLKFQTGQPMTASFAVLTKYFAATPKISQAPFPVEVSIKCRTVVAVIFRQQSYVVAFIV